MDLFGFFSFLLLLYNLINATFSSEEQSEGLGNIVINSLEGDVLNGVIHKKVEESLTLSCTYYAADSVMRQPDEKKLIWQVHKDPDRITFVTSKGSLWLKIKNLTLNDTGRYTCVDSDNTVGYVQVQVSPTGIWKSSPSTTEEDGLGTLVVNSLEKDSLNDVIYRKVQDNLTLSCTYYGPDNAMLPAERRRLIWSVPNEYANRTKMWITKGILWLTVRNLTVNDTGRYACVDTDNMYVVGQVQVQIRSAASHIPFCSEGSMFMCWGQEIHPLNIIQGTQCILFSYLCDGRPDCLNGRDEHVDTCTDDPCKNKLMCADGRCIPKDWCCGNGTFNRYGRNGSVCIPHPCCAQHFKAQERFPERTGGGLRKKSNGSPLLQMTLYTASFCALIFLISITFLVSIICRARLKRSAELVQSRTSNNNAPRQEGPQSNSTRCNYTLVPATCDTPTSTYSAVFRRYFDISLPNNTPPPYSQATTDQRDDSELPSYFEVQQETENGDSGVQVRRPTDFGMSTLANAFFNARYRPVPQEIVSFGDVSDSDSSCRSPGSHTFNIYPTSNGGRPRIESPLSRFGETPEAYLARRSAEQQRIRRANALDRILDRFGLNAPYAVGRDATHSGAENTNDSSQPVDEDATHINGRRRFLNSILGRLRNGFQRNMSNDDQQASNNVEAAANTVSIQNNISSNVAQGERRRPDTPDVLELSLDEIDLCRNSTGDTFTLNGRTIHLLGANLEDQNNMYGLSVQGFYLVDGIVENLNRFVGRPISPPPYSEVANVAPPKIMGPPPPYKSRENLNNDVQPGPSSSSNMCNNISSTPSTNIDTNNSAEVITNLTSSLITDVNNGDDVLIVAAVPSTSSGVVSSVVNNNTSHDSTNADDSNTNEIFMDIVNCRDDSMSSLNLDSIECTREKDLRNENLHSKDESVNSFSLLDNIDQSMSSNYSLKRTVNRSDLDNNNFDITSPSCSNNNRNNLLNNTSDVARSDTMNDLSNNNNISVGDSNIRQLSMSVLECNNGNLSNNDNLVSNCARDATIGKNQSLQRSVFPPISLEFIDSDCITE